MNKCNTVDNQKMGIVDIINIVMNQFFSTSSSTQAPVQAAENANAAFCLKRKHELEQDEDDDAGSLIKKIHKVGQTWSYEVASYWSLAKNP